MDGCVWLPIYLGAGWILFVDLLVASVKIKLPRRGHVVFAEAHASSPKPIFLFQRDAAVSQSDEANTFPAYGPPYRRRRMSDDFTLLSWLILCNTASVS
jgi:hypothetical protein